VADPFRKSEGGTSDGTIRRGGTGWVVGASAPSAHIWALSENIYTHLVTHTPFSYDFNPKITRNRNNQPKKSHIMNFKPDMLIMVEVRRIARD
jgi:hypothetical protein